LSVTVELPAMLDEKANAREALRAVAVGKRRDILAGEPCFDRDEIDLKSHGRGFWRDIAVRSAAPDLGANVRVDPVQGVVERYLGKDQPQAVPYVGGPPIHGESRAENLPEQV